MGDKLQRHRVAYGASYMCGYGAFLEQLAPAVEKLAGQ